VPLGVYELGELRPSNSYAKRLPHFFRSSFPVFYIKGPMKFRPKKGD
jgi:hypothetical protein